MSLLASHPNCSCDPNISPPVHAQPDIAPFANPTDHVVVTAKAIGDELRANIVRALGQDSFGVTELGHIFDTSQPAMSHHLKILRGAGLVTQRREGTSIFYQRAIADLPFASACFAALDESKLPQAPLAAINAIYAERATQSQAFFDQHADALTQQNTLICTPQVYVQTVLNQVRAYFGSTQPRALEVGPGHGTLLRALAPHFVQLTGVDNSSSMLAETQAATTDLDNVELLGDEFTQLSSQTAYELIAATMVVHHMPSPARFFQKAASLLCSNGLLVVAELCAHDQAWAKEHCGDLWLGFQREELDSWASQAGLQIQQHQSVAQRNGFNVQVHAYTQQPQYDQQEEI